MDRIDHKILIEVQRDATIPIAVLADKVGLSQTPCWKRLRKLQDQGVITGRVALVDPAKVGLGLTVFVEIATLDHTPAARAAVADLMAKLPEVLEVYRMAGEADYLLKVLMPDMAAYDAFYKRLTDALSLRSVTSRFAMERMKITTIHPLTCIGV